MKIDELINRILFYSICPSNKRINFEMETDVKMGQISISRNTNRLHHPASQNQITTGNRMRAIAGRALRKRGVSATCIRQRSWIMDASIQVHVRKWHFISTCNRLSGLPPARINLLEPNCTMLDKQVKSHLPVLLSSFCILLSFVRRTRGQRRSEFSSSSPVHATLVATRFNPRIQKF